MIPYDKINIDAPVSDAFGQVGRPKRARRMRAVATSRMHRDAHGP